MKIDKNIQIHSMKRGRKPKYPFGEMDVGDSIFFEGVKNTLGSKEYSAAQMHGIYNSKKFTGAAVEGGLRIWRIK